MSRSRRAVATTDADRMPRPRRITRRPARRTTTRQAYVAAALADRI
jgi:hypothetical protein